MKKGRILIADDVSLNREMLAEMLGGSYEFSFASDGVEAIDIIRGDKNIDLVLLDLNMPRMDGFEVLKIMNQRHWIEEIPVIVISSDDSSETIERAYELGVVDFLNRPFRTIVVQHRVKNTLAMYTNQGRLIGIINQQVYEKEKVNNAMVNIFSNAIETRNHESGSHTLNVQNITKLLLTHLSKITDKYDLNESRISLISTLAALHDIGKIKIPDSILNKPGKLTPEEWEIMKSHSVEGEKFLSNPMLDQNSEFIKTARQICRYHHEKYDGKGYPDGLAGDQIPICAQAVSMADVYDALTSERCYKAAFSHEKSIEMIANGECGAFNPLLIQCLKEASSELKKVKASGDTFDYKNEASHVSDELLTSNNLPKGNGMRRMMDNEKAKKDFFMGCAEGLQFEYDTLMQKILLVYNDSDGKPSHKVNFFNRDSKNSIFTTKAWDEIHDRLTKTTKDNPIVVMDTEIVWKDQIIPCHADLMAIWPEDGIRFISVIGHLKRIDK